MQEVYKPGAGVVVGSTGSLGNQSVLCSLTYGTLISQEADVNGSVV